MTKICQGQKRCPQNDNTITEYGVISKIIDIKLVNENEGILQISLKLLTGSHIGRVVIDRVSYLENRSLSWKYFAIRDAVGCPYNINEAEEIDIDEILLNKNVVLNLSSYAYESKGVEYKGQKINYVYTPEALEKLKDFNLYEQNKDQVQDYNDSGEFDPIFLDENKSKDPNFGPFSDEWIARIKKV